MQAPKQFHAPALGEERLPMPMAERRHKLPHTKEDFVAQGVFFLYILFFLFTVDFDTEGVNHKRRNNRLNRNND